MKPEPKRYQECSWIVRMWRRRHYLRVPWLGLSSWVDQIGYPDPDWDMPLRDHFKLAVGLIEGDMNWYYTMEECEERWEQRFPGYKARKEERKKNAEAIIAGTSGNSCSGTEVS